MDWLLGWIESHLFGFGVSVVQLNAESHTIDATYAVFKAGQWPVPGDT